MPKPSFRLPAPPAFLLASALALFTGAMPAFAAQDDLRLEVARQWAEKGDYEKAVQELRLFLNEHPDAAEVYARIGSLRLRQGRLSQATESFKVALRKDPSLAEAKDGLAKVKEMEARGEALPPGPAPAAAARPSSSTAPSGDAHESPRSEPAGYSPAMDSSGSAADGIYAQKDFQEALRLYREKKPDEALGRLKTVLARHPGHPGAYYLGGVIRYEKGDLSKAAFNFKRSVDYPDRGFNAHFYLGRIHQKQNKVPEAIGHYENYLKATRSETGRKQVEGYLALLRGKAAKPGEPQAAQPPIQAAAKPEAPRPQEHGAAAQHADTVHGEKAHGEIAPGDKAHGDGHASAADSGSHGASPAPAAPDRSPSPLVLAKAGFLPFVVADSSEPSGRKLMEAYEAFRKEKFEKAADLLKETIRAYGGSPNAEAANLDLAAVYVRLGLWDNARDRILDYLSGARQPQRYRDLAFYLEGLMHLGKKDGEKAERALLKVKPDGFGGPSREEVDFRLAQAAEMMKDMKKWAAYLEKAQASAKDPRLKARLWHQSGQLHGRHGRAERAIEYYRKVLAGCGKEAAEEGSAGAEASKAAEAADLCADSRLRVADLEFRRKRWKEALAEYRKFASGNPDHKESAWVHYQIANVYQATRNLESALNEYKKVIDNYPDSYWASQAQWKREDAIWRKEYEEVLD